MKLRLWLPILLVLLTASTNVQAKGPFAQGELGNWALGVYTLDSGAFSHCVGVASYGRLSFAVSVDAGFLWFLGFTHPSWRLRPGEKIPITLVFDGRRKFSVTGYALNESFIKVDMPVKSDLINTFRLAYGMEVSAKGDDFKLQLTATSRLLPVLADCTKRNQGRHQANLLPAIEKEYKNLSKPDAQPAEETASVSSNELQMEAMQLATNFILASRTLNNPKVLSPKETPVAFASFGAAWQSDEAVGAVKIIPPDGGQTKGLDVAAAVAAADSQACKGKFASGRVSELVDSEVVFRGFSRCEDSDGARSAEFFVVPRKAGGFIIFSVVDFQSAGSSDSSNPLKDDNLDGFQKAALAASQ